MMENLVVSVISAFVASLVAILIWEWVRKPFLSLEVPTNNEPSVQDLGGGISRGFYHLVVKNAGMTPAYNCKIFMTLVDSNGNKMFTVNGKWDRGPQPLLYAHVPYQVSATKKILTRRIESPHDFLVPFAEVLDIHPKMPEGFGVLVKYDGENSCYAFSSWGYLKGQGHRVDEWRLNRGNYYAEVDLRYSGGKYIGKFII